MPSRSLPSTQLSLDLDRSLLPTLLAVPEEAVSALADLLLAAVGPAWTQSRRRAVMSSKITAEHLARSAMVYVRQSTMTQVLGNTESQRRQYGLADQARAAGFATVDVIDEDLGRSGSGVMERPGFQKLVAAVCAGSVGAVFCIEASRLARNGRDWHHLIDLCALAATLVIDPDGI
jgi:hypothetical protein